MHEIPTLNADYSDHCPQCNRPGTVGGYMCLKCITEQVRCGNTKPLRYLPEFWRTHPDVDDIAQMLIGRHLPDISDARIVYVFRSKHSSTNGKMKLGCCQKQSAKHKLLHGYDYAIELAWDLWVLLDPWQQEALLLHELCHVSREEDGEEVSWKSRPHDVEEFREVVKVYGLWNADLCAFDEMVEAYRSNSHRMAEGE